MQEFNDIFAKGCELQDGLIHIDGYRRQSLTDAQRQRLEDSIQQFQKCLDMMAEQLAKHDANGKSDAAS